MIDSVFRMLKLRRIAVYVLVLTIIESVVYALQLEKGRYNRLCVTDSK